MSLFGFVNGLLSIWCKTNIINNLGLTLIKRSRKCWWETTANYTPRNEVRGGGILDSPCLSVRLSVCLLPFRVRPVASTVQDGFFPYLVQMINSMWWPLTLTYIFKVNRPWLRKSCLHCSATFLDGFFLYLAQMITIIRGGVAFYVFSNFLNLNFWQIFEIFRPWHW